MRSIEEHVTIICLRVVEQWNTKTDHENTEDSLNVLWHLLKFIKIIKHTTKDTGIHFPSQF